MEIKTIKIFRTADSFLYLPIYVARELGIFKELLPNVEIILPEIVKESDIYCTMQMLKSNNSEENNVSIAIADPTAFLSKDWDKKYSDDDDKELRNDCKIIGTLIKKLPFWAVNHRKIILKSEKALKTYYKNVVFYGEELVTGNYLGQDLKKELNLSKIEVLNMGDEFHIINENNKLQEKDTFAISADIVGLAKNVNQINRKKNLHINYSFSSSKKREDFFTTGILTSKNKVDNNGEELSKIIEAIQKSILFLYSSNIAAEFIAGKVNEIRSKENGSEKLNNKQVNFIVEKITKEKIYPYDLNISFNSWKNAIIARYEVEGEGEGDKFDNIPELYDNHVDETIVHNAEKNLAFQLGVNLETFSDEFKAERKRRRWNWIRVLYSKVLNLKDLVYNNKKGIFKVVTIIIIIWIIIVGISISLKEEDFTINKLLEKSTVPLIVLLLSFTLSNLNKKNDNSKQN